MHTRVGNRLGSEVYVRGNLGMGREIGVSCEFIFLFNW